MQRFGIQIFNEALKPTLRVSFSEFEESRSRRHEALSGEKQGIFIARALPGKPRLLLFDEAISALNSLTEENILATISSIPTSHQQITVLIAHHISTILHADAIFVLEKGRVYRRWALTLGCRKRRGSATQCGGSRLASGGDGVMAKPLIYAQALIFLRFEKGWVSPRISRGVSNLTVRGAGESDELIAMFRRLLLLFQHVFFVSSPRSCDCVSQSPQFPLSEAQGLRKHHGQIWRDHR
jgi:energy-coupling factor transporter ATP-binding protein EcfA2